jgi:hypothetical protein
MVIKCECCPWNVCHFVLLESHLSIIGMWAIVWSPCFGALFRFTKLEQQLQCKENILDLVFILSKLGWFHNIYEIKNYTKPRVDCVFYSYIILWKLFFIHSVGWFLFSNLVLLVLVFGKLWKSKKSSSRFFTNPHENCLFFWGFVIFMK